MKKVTRLIIISVIIMLPILLLSKLAFNEGHITYKDVAITLAESLLDAIVITAVINWIGKQQPNKV